jgi:hypothetical protein
MSGLMTADEFMAELDRRVPEAAELVRDQLGFMEVPHLHLLLPELLRMATELYASGQTETLARLQNLVAEGMAHGDEDVENAVAVSFVEHLGAFLLETPAFIAQLPQPLLGELRRQKDEWASRENTHPQGLGPRSSC